MSWLRVESGAPDHFKVRRVARQLRVQQELAWGLISALWLRLSQQRPDGSLEGMGPDDVEALAGYTGERGNLYAAMVEACLIDTEDGSAKSIHDWSEYAEGWIRAQKERDRRAKKRDARVTNRGARVVHGGARVTDRAPDRPDGPTDLTDGADDLSGSAGPKKAKPANRHAQEITQVVEHYKAHHPRARPGDKEKRLIRARLEEGYSALDLCEAIDGNHNDSWHVKVGKHELAYIMRDSSQVARFIDVQRKGPQAVMTDNELANRQAEMQWNQIKDEEERRAAGNARRES